MNILAVVLVVLSAFLHATWNMLAKQSGNKLAFLWAANIAAITAFSPLFLFMLYRHPIPAEGWPFILATGFIHGGYITFLSKAYSHGALSVTYPISRGTGAALVPLLAIPLLDERVSGPGAIGIGLVIAGILTMHSRALRSLILQPLGITSTSVSLPEQRLGTAFALLTGLTIAGYSLVDKAGVARVHPVVYGYLIFASMTVLLTPVVLSRMPADARAEWRRNRSTIVVCGVMSLGTYLVILGALTLAQVSYIVPLREVSVLIAAIFGTVFLGEPFDRLRLAGCLCILAGVLTISIAG